MITDRQADLPAASGNHSNAPRHRLILVDCTSLLVLNEKDLIYYDLLRTNTSGQFNSSYYKYNTHCTDGPAPISISNLKSNTAVSTVALTFKLNYLRDFNATDY